MMYSLQGHCSPPCVLFKPSSKPQAPSPPAAPCRFLPPAPSRPVRFFTYMATGPLKGAMLQFFADSTNFTRRWGRPWGCLGCCKVEPQAMPCGCASDFSQLALSCRVALGHPSTCQACAPPSVPLIPTG